MAKALEHNLIGKKVGEYDITAQVGKGGMGAVYEGLQSVIGKRVAVKVLLPHLSSDEELVQRFAAEARAVNAIRHRGIVDIFSFGQLETGSHYFVMEYLEGQPFDVVIKERAPMATGSVLGVLEETLDALDAAHTAGIIHRDIKPSNLFVVNTGRGRPYLKLLDFGIAKLSLKTGQATPETRVSMVIGTPTYMSPEQARGQKATGLCDVYALGCVAFEALTGRQPYIAESLTGVMFMHIEDPTPHVRDLNPDVSEEVDALVFSMMEKEASARPQSAAVLRDAVAALRPRYVDELFSTVATPPPSQRTRPAIRTPLPAVVTRAAPPEVDEVKTRITRPPEPVKRSRWPLAVVGLMSLSAASAWAVLTLTEKKPAPPAFEIAPLEAEPVHPELSAEGAESKGAAKPPPQLVIDAPTGKEPELIAVNEPRPPKKAAPRIATQAELKTRLRRIEARAAAKREKTGDADPVLERFLDQARTQIAAANSAEQRQSASVFLADLERQLDGR